MTTRKDTIYYFEPAFENKENLKGTLSTFKVLLRLAWSLWQRVDLEKPATIDFTVQKCI